MAEQPISSGRAHRKRAASQQMMPSVIENRGAVRTSSGDDRREHDAMQSAARLHPCCTTTAARWVSGHLAGVRLGEIVVNVWDGSDAAHSHSHSYSSMLQLSLRRRATKRKRILASPKQRQLIAIRPSVPLLDAGFWLARATAWTAVLPARALALGTEKHGPLLVPSVPEPTTSVANCLDHWLSTGRRLAHWQIPCLS